MKDLILDHKDELRMYGLVAYQLSGTIHAGIQFGHAVVEYGLKYGKSPCYTQWAENDKTFIVLNGGTTNSRLIDGIPFGSLNQHVITLKEMGIATAEFYEPDLGEQLTATVFIIPKQVYNKKEYPGFEDYVKTLDFTEEYQEFLIKSFYDEDGGPSPLIGTYGGLTPHLHMPTFEEYLEIYTSWVDSLGGVKNVKLREFLSQFSFA
jgi:hypothetical protein